MSKLNSGLNISLIYKECASNYYTDTLTYSVTWQDPLFYSNLLIFFFIYFTLIEHTYNILNILLVDLLVASAR